MSYLEIPPTGLGGSDSFFKSASEGWGPFTFLTRKEDRKAIKDRAKAGAIEAQTATASASAASRLAALQGLRDKIDSRMQQAEAEAAQAGVHVENIRSLANDPRLLGEAVLDSALLELDELEVLVIQIHAGTQIDTATDDTQLLAQSYAEAQAALAGLRIVKARAAGIEKRLSEHLNKLKLEQDRIRELEKRRAALAIQEKVAAVAAQKALEEELRQAQSELEFEARTARKRAELQQLRDLSDAIREEKRALSLLREELEAAKRKKREGEDRRRALVQQRARLEALRSPAGA